MPNKQWHPVFVAALKETLKEARPGQIEIEAEVALSSRPLDVDVLVVKKAGETGLSHPIAKSFRRYNLFRIQVTGRLPGSQRL